MKTIQQWFKIAKKDGYEWIDQAYANEALSGGNIRYKTGSLSRALQAAFDWESSPEGFEFWSSICKQLRSENK